jgi:hypothetical protein
MSGRTGPLRKHPEVTIVSLQYAFRIPPFLLEVVGFAEEFDFEYYFTFMVFSRRRGDVSMGEKRNRG